MFECFQRGTLDVSSGIWLFVVSVLQVMMSNPNSWDPISIASAVHCVQSSAILLIGFQVLGCSLIQIATKAYKQQSTHDSNLVNAY